MDFVFKILDDMLNFIHNLIQHNQFKHYLISHYNDIQIHKVNSFKILFL
jgi:hypothetical protein